MSILVANDAQQWNTLTMEHSGSGWDIRSGEGSAWAQARAGRGQWTLLAPDGLELAWCRRAGAGWLIERLGEDDCVIQPGGTSGMLRTWDLYSGASRWLATWHKHVGRLHVHDVRAGRGVGEATSEWDGWQVSVHGMDTPLCVAALLCMLPGTVAG